jgi:hypothetical protein
MIATTPENLAVMRELSGAFDPIFINPAALAAFLKRTLVHVGGPPSHDSRAPRDIIVIRNVLATCQPEKQSTDDRFQLQLFLSSARSTSDRINYCSKIERTLYRQLQMFRRT